MEVVVKEWGDVVLDVGEVTRAARRSASEVSLRFAPFVKVSPEFDGKVRLSATRKVGEAQLGELLVRVDPHIEVGSMLALLGWLTRGRIHLIETALGASRKQPFSLRSAVAAGLVIALSELLRGEVHRHYARRSERLLILRGRPDFARLGDGPSARGVPCRYLELSRDTLPNQVLAASALEALRLLAGTSFAARARSVATTLSQLVDRPRGQAHDFARAREQIGHRDEVYHPVLDLAQMLLLGGGPVSVVGKGGMSGWWIDMPSLFERAVVQAITRWADRIGLRVRSQPRHRGAILDAELQPYKDVRPDLELLDTRNQCVAILDAKYKDYLRPDGDRPARTIDRDDIYQLAFYGARAPEARLFLIAPSAPGELIDARYRTLYLHGSRLEIVGLPLGNLPEVGELALW